MPTFQALKDLRAEGSSFRVHLANWPLPQSCFTCARDASGHWELAAEVSELKSFRLMEQLYNDAADVGFVMLSERTQRLAVFSLAEEHRQDGDITYWTFHPTSQTVRRIPSLEGSCVTIFND